MPARGAWTEFGTRVPASELFSRGSSRRTAFSRAGTSFDDGDVASRRTAAPKPGRLTRSGSFESRIKPSSLKESAGAWSGAVRGLGVARRQPTLLTVVWMYVTGAIALPCGGKWQAVASGLLCPSPNAMRSTLGFPTKAARAT